MMYEQALQKKTLFNYTLVQKRRYSVVSHQYDDSKLKKPLSPWFTQKYVSVVRFKEQDVRIYLNMSNSSTINCVSLTYSPFSPITFMLYSRHCVKLLEKVYVLPTTEFNPAKYHLLS